jgi:hypothetical protein
MKHEIVEVPLSLIVFMSAVPPPQMEMQPPQAPGSTSMPNENARMSYRAKFIKQVHLLVWRRYRELTHSPWDILKLVLAPILLFSLILLFYVQFSWLFSSGALKPGFFEYYLIPIAFWITVIKTCAYAVTDKSNKVKESMRMMGLLESAYFTSIFVTEGVFIGGLVSFVGATFTAFSQPSNFNGISTGGTVEFLNGASFGNTFGLFFLFVMSAVPFSLFITSFFDRPAVATNITIIILLTCYCAVTSGKFQVEGDDEATAAIMLLMALAPPMALQIGCDSLSYGASNPKYPAIESLFSMLLFDIFVYIFAAWYASYIFVSVSLLSPLTHTHTLTPSPSPGMQTKSFPRNTA